MRKIQEILRLKEAGLSNRQIAKSVNVSPSTVSVLLSQAEKAGLSWPLPEDLDETALTAMLYPGTEKPENRPLPDMEWIHKELKRKGVTLQLLWEEYKEQYPGGYRYSYFCELYYNWRQKLDPPLRKVHRVGEKMFVDFAGQTVLIIDPKTGQELQAYIFIAVLGASNYTFARAVLSQDLENWILLHCLSFEYFNGVAEVIVPDNPRTAVTSPCRYEPVLVVI
jgi:transposase